MSSADLQTAGTECIYPRNTNAPASCRSGHERSHPLPVLAIITAAVVERLAESFGVTSALLTPALVRRPAVRWSSEEHRWLEHCQGDQGRGRLGSGDAWTSLSGLRYICCMIFTQWPICLWFELSSVVAGTNLFCLQAS